MPVTPIATSNGAHASSADRSSDRRSIVSKSNGVRKMSTGCAEADVPIGGERRGHVVERATSLEVPLILLWQVRVAPAGPRALGRRPVGPDHRVEVHRALDRRWIPPHRIAGCPKDMIGGRHLLGRAVHVPQVRVPRDQRQRLLRARAADQDREVLLDRSRGAHSVAEAVEAAVVGDRVAVEQAPDERDRLPQAVETLTEPGAEVEPERLVLALEPATADAQDRATARDVIERGRELARSARGCGWCWRRPSGQGAVGT